jgi:CRP/FNR family cyclic AMP-dependent transcriptional regulator
MMKTEAMESIKPASLTELLGKYPLRKVKKGQTVLYQGEVPRFAYIVKEGVIKSYNINAGGEEKIITFISEADLLSPGWVFDKTTVSLYFYDAFTDCELYTIPKEDLLTLLDGKDELSRTLLYRFASLYVGGTVQVNALVQSKSADKIIHMLQHLIMRFGEERGKNLWRISLRLTQQDLASMIGLTRETIATELSKLKKRGIVFYIGQHYLVRTDKLQQMLGEDNFQGIQL